MPQWRGEHNMKPAEYRARLKSLELTNQGFCRMVGLNGRTGRYYVSGQYPIPSTVAALLRLAAATQITKKKLSEIIHQL